MVVFEVVVAVVMVAVTGGGDGDQEVRRKYNKVRGSFLFLCFM